jgi:acetylornithine deacetylase/succinyl-diaminopimelate desuccinylase-like protein
MADEIKTFLAAHEGQLVDELSDWVRVPSVAGVPEHEVDVLRSANWLAAALRDAGFPEVEVWSEQAAPTVFGAWCVEPGAPTVLVYGHHDVRAAEAGQWVETAPFDPVRRDGFLYGRGTSDAKGQVLAHLWGLRAHLAATGRDAPAVNLKLLVEGEEEAGSSGLADLLRTNRARLAADLVVFSDTLLWHQDHPAVCTSMRGMLSAHLEVFGPHRDVHSGTVSGAAPNPARELCALVGRLHDDKGRVTLPGFYDAVVEPTDRSRAELADLPLTRRIGWLVRRREASPANSATPRWSGCGSGPRSRCCRSWPATRSAWPAGPSPRWHQPTSVFVRFPTRRSVR